MSPTAASIHASCRLIGAAFSFLHPLQPIPFFHHIFYFSVAPSFSRVVGFSLDALEHVLLELSASSPTPWDWPNIGRSVGRLLIVSLSPTARSVGRSSRAISRALCVFFSFSPFVFLYLSFSFSFSRCNRRRLLFGADAIPLKVAIFIRYIYDAPAATLEDCLNRVISNQPLFHYLHNTTCSHPAVWFSFNWKI